MTMIVSAIAWNDSNLFGFTLLFREFLRSHSDQVSLNVYLGPKVSQEARSALNTSCFSSVCPIDTFKVYELNSTYDLLFFFVTGTTFAALSKRISSRHRQYVSAYFLPSPSNPPLLFFLPRDVYFYGDGLGSAPSLNYQWQPSLFRLPLHTFLRYAALIVDRQALLRTKNISSTTFYDLLSRPQIRSEISRLAASLYLANNTISSYLDSCPFSSSNIIIVLSMLSPSRCSFQSEIDLYVDQLQFSYSENLAALESSSIFFKFHFHHSQDFKDRFIAHVSSRLGLQTYCLDLNIPIEAIGCLLPRSFPSLIFTFFCYQESMRLLADYGDSASRAVSVRFGFEDFLLNRHLSQDEATKKIVYQKALISKTYGT
jgi:hypothetical protein